MTAIERAISFLDVSGRMVEAAWARYVCADGPRYAVIKELGRYQNEDGGFGRELEVDIKAPESNPFAARLAMHVLVSIEAKAEEPIVQRLGAWLEREQGEDGCWRFSPGVYEQGLAPWFAGWTFPSLNPALCLAGYATRLGIGSERLHERARTLADEMASLDEARTGAFYDMLPYTEYFPWVDHPKREAYLRAVAESVMRFEREGGYADAHHFFEHVEAGGEELARRIPPALIEAQLDRLLGEQQPDGGWPTPYDPAWRSWTTAGNAITLKKHARG